jgi:cholesterol transport system auxiliary component
MNRRLVAGLVAAIALGGCTLIDLSGIRKKEYTLYAPSAAAPVVQFEKNGKPSKSSAILRVVNLSVPVWLNSTNIYYRLEYRNGGEIAPYSQARWVSSPAILIRLLVQNTLAADPFWKAVIGPESLAQADYKVELRITDFQQVFIKPDQSKGLLRAFATLVDNEAGAMVAQREFRFETLAPSADVEGGTRALSKNAYKLAQAVRSWLRQVVVTREQPDDIPDV